MQLQGNSYNDPQVLLDDFRNGSQNALKYIYDLHYHSLWLYANRMVGDEELADDIVAESIVKLWNKRSMFDSIRGMISYLYTIIRNASNNQLNADTRDRKFKSELGYLANQDNTVYQGNEAEEIRARLIQLVFQEIYNLPPRMKEVFQLGYIEGKSSHDIAKILSLSPYTVNHHKKLALKKIRKALFKKGFANWVVVLEIIAQFKRFD